MEVEPGDFPIIESPEAPLDQSQPALKQDSPVIPTEMFNADQQVDQNDDIAFLANIGETIKDDDIEEPVINDLPE